ncbi:MAG: SGNH/GDSL hydrolase family protein [Planctomycetes bacterium]|nr:SGNH/GDSL hydrolase family protein [Planctomycetota bacterium]
MSLRGLLMTFLGSFAGRVLWGAIVDHHEHTREPALVFGQDLERALFEEVRHSPAELVDPAAADASLDPSSEGYRFYRYDPARGFRLAPNAVTDDFVIDGHPELGSYTITTDALGLRGAPRPPPEPGALKVLVLGDSMTFGKGVQDGETFPCVLEGLLAERLGRPVRVYNAGVSSYGQIEEAATLAELAPQLEPDVVLLAFTLANDLSDDLRWREGVQPLVRDDEAAELFQHLALDNPLAWWSRTYRLLAWRWGRHVLRYRIVSEPGVLDRGARLLAKVRDAAGGSPFGVAIVPPQFEVQGHWAVPLMATDAIRAGLTQRLEQLGIPLCDPLAALQAEDASDQALYIPGDLHFTAAGHRAFAEAIAPFVAELAGARK